MRIYKISASELDDGLRRRWREIQGTNPSLRNPYFCPEYTESVAAVRDDVFLGILEEQDGRVAGIFPFQMATRHIAEPVGGRMSDYQGLIVSPGTECDAGELLRGCGLKVWKFDHLLEDQACFSGFHGVKDFSQAMDMSNGYDAYLAEKRKSGSRRLAQFQRKGRKFEREVGAFRFETYSTDEDAFEQVIAWKREQCIRTGAPDFLGWGWTRALLERIWRIRNTHFSGMLSVLYHDETIIAAHFGMKSSTVCHWWFPTYNSEYSRYSPGGVLLLKLAESVAADGITLVDLGKGKEEYKPSFSNYEIGLAEGAAFVPSPIAFLYKARQDSEQFLRRSPYAERVKTPIRKVRRLLGKRSA